MLSIKRFQDAFIILLCLIAMSGCATRLGPGAADGTYLTINGEVINAYDRKYNEMVQAGLDLLSAMKMPIRYKRELPNETIVLTQTWDDLPLKVRFIQEGRNLTVVKVRTGYVGFWDKEFSHIIHTLITEQLKRRTRPPSDTPAISNTTTALKEVNSETSETRPTVSAPAPPPASKSYSRSIPTTTERSASAPTVSVPERAAPPVSEEKPSEFPLSEPDITVYFEEDSNLPNPDEMAKLEQAAHQAFENPQWHMALTGYAGSQENNGHPQMVSESRVSAVKFYLIGKGVDANRIVTIAQELGLSEKVVSAQRLRRVEIRFLLGP